VLCIAGSQTQVLLTPCMARTETLQRMALPFAVQGPQQGGMDPYAQQMQMQQQAAMQQMGMGGMQQAGGPMGAPGMTPGMAPGMGGMGGMGF